MISNEPYYENMLTGNGKPPAAGFHISGYLCVKNVSFLMLVYEENAFRSFVHHILQYRVLPLNQNAS